MTMSGVILFVDSMFVLVVCWLNNPLWKGVAEFFPLLLAHGEFSVVEQAGFQLGEEIFPSASHRLRCARGSSRHRRR